MNGVCLYLAPELGCIRVLWSSYKKAKLNIFYLIQVLFICQAQNKCLIFFGQEIMCSVFYRTESFIPLPASMASSPLSLLISSEQWGMWAWDVQGSAACIETNPATKLLLPLHFFMVLLNCSHLDCSFTCEALTLYKTLLEKLQQKQVSYFSRQD